MDMKDIYTIKTILNIIGVKKEKTVSVMQICVIVSFALLLGNCTASVVHYWADHGQRYTSIKDFNIIITLFVIYVDFSVCNRQTYRLQRLVDAGLFRYGEGSAPEDGATFAERNARATRRVNKLIFYFSLSVVMTVSLAPMFITVYMVVNKGYVDDEAGRHVTVRNLPSPITTYYPDGYATVTVYVINYMFQAICYLVLLHGTGYCAYIVAFDTTNNLSDEIRLLCSCLEQADRIVSRRAAENYDTLLKEYLRNVVDHHAVILSKVKLVENGLRVNTSAFSHALVVQLCMSIYTLVQAEDVMLIIENFVTSITVLLNLFMSYNQAQHIIDKSKELRHSIFHSSWMSKPLWFKKSVLIMSICANKELQIFPYGVYVMNRSSFSKVINLSYTYYNLMKSIKRP